MMTDSEQIQDSVLVREEMQAHWVFLSEFLHELLEIGVIEDFDADKLSLIQYGFFLAYPHAWKHGFKHALSLEDDELEEM